MNRMRVEKRLRGRDGFSLLEIIIGLAVISILSAVMAPLVFQFMNDNRETETRREMAAIHLAIMGDQAQGQYGYVGDMGGLPGSLADLNTKPGGADNYTSTGRVNGIGIGWNGPYLNIGYSTSDYLKDAWGRNYSYNNSNGQITSWGSDGAQGTNDDIVIPPYSVDTNGDVSVTVTVYNSNTTSITTIDNTLVGVEIYFSNGGVEDSDPATWSTVEDAFIYTGLHQGIHAVVATGIDSCAGTEAKANAPVFKGTTSLNVFLGTFAL